MKALLTKTVNPEHGAGGGGPQPTRTRVRRPSEERAGGGEGREGSHVQNTNV